MKSVEVTIKGSSSLLMHRFPLVAVEAIEKKTIDEQAEIAAYRIPDTNSLYIPGSAVQRCLVGAAAYSKGKGRSTLQKVVAAAVFVTPEYLDLGTEEYIVDSRSVVVPATKGRVVRHRPRLDQWAVSFSLEYDENLMTEQQVRKVVDDAGSLVGLLDYRPEKKGPFGRFMVTSWKASR